MELARARLDDDPAFAGAGARVIGGYVSVGGDKALRKKLRHEFLPADPFRLDMVAAALADLDWFALVFLFIVGPRLIVYIHNRQLWPFFSSSILLICAHYV